MDEKTANPFNNFSFTFSKSVMRKKKNKVLYKEFLSILFIRIYGKCYYYRYQ